MTETIEVNADTAPMFLALRDVFCAIADHIDAALPGETRVALTVRQWIIEPSIAPRPASAAYAATAKLQTKAPAPAKPKVKRKPYTVAEKAVVLAKVRRHVKAKSRNPIAAVAAETGVTYPTVQKWARAAGLVK